MPANGTEVSGLKSWRRQYEEEILSFMLAYGRIRTIALINDYFNLSMNQNSLS